ncbi:hypothetical protein BH20BAC1_BH20BAC1_11490 [soil metagenome]
MIRNWKILFAFTLFVSLALVSSADRGGFIRRDKTKLNIETAHTLKSSIQFNLRSNLDFRGTMLLNHTRIGNSIVSDAIVAYKKGNTTYLMPYKHKMIIPSYTRSDGYKLIIRHK